MGEAIGALCCEKMRQMVLDGAVEDWGGELRLHGKPDRWEDGTFESLAFGFCPWCGKKYEDPPNKPEPARERKWYGDPMYRDG